MKRADYPLLLAPHLAKRVWGGNRLGDGVGEAWDLSVHPHGTSRVVNGPLSESTLDEIDVGAPVNLLAKRLDCRQRLSVQVHPKTGEPKTEAWVVFAAEAGAGIYHGFRRPVSRDEIRAAAADGSLPELLRFHPVFPDDVVFVPAGTVHAIGAGLHLFEIQQSADTTFRLHDWGRGRELHVDAALECLDLDSRDPFPEPDLPRLLSCEHFFLERHEGRAELDPRDSWVALHVVEGEGRLGGLRLDVGATCLVPRDAGPQVFEGDGAALVYGPP